MALRQAAKTLTYPFLRLGRGYDSLARNYPQSTAIITTTIKTSAADAFAQLVVEKREGLDWRRHGMFVGFGFAYLGVWQYYLYNVLFARWCGSITRVVGHWGSAPVKTFLDQAIHHPLLYFPCFYMLKGWMEGRSAVDSVKKSFVELPENVKALWAVWVPAQLLNFSVVPAHLRIPFVALTSFLWTIIISNLRGQMEPPEPPKTVPAALATPAAATSLSGAAAVAPTAAVGAAAGGQPAAVTGAALQGTNGQTALPGAALEATSLGSAASPALRP